MDNCVEEFAKYDVDEASSHALTHLHEDLQRQ